MVPRLTGAASAPTDPIHPDTQAHRRFRARREAEAGRLYAHTPAKMRERRQWVLWEWERDADGRWTKVPYRARDLERKASSTDPNTWASFESAAGQFECGHGAGIGYVLADDDPHTVVDLDGCLDPTTRAIVDPLARRIVEALDSYTEVTPSGRGLHVWIEAELPFAGRNDRALGVEVYDADRFITVTGDMPPSRTRIRARQAALDALLTELWPEIRQAAGSGSGPDADPHRAAARPRISPPLADWDVLVRAATARNGDKFVRLWRGDTADYPSNSEADLALINLLIFYTQD